MATTLTIDAINEGVRALGGTEELVKGDTFFYFTKGLTGFWRYTSVLVPNLNDLTLEGWLDEYKALSTNSPIPVR